MTDRMRSEFEEWYAINAFDYAANPIGSRECGLQWTAWQAARTVPEKVECGCGDIYPASQFMCANCLAAVGAADELRRVDEAQSVPVVGEPDCYDAGLLNDFGGGNVEWWQDYIRYELERAHEFYVSQWPVVQAPVVSSVVGYLAGGTLMRRKIQGYECKPLVVQPTHSIPAAELASLREKAAEADELRKDAERLQYMLDEAAIIMCAVGTTSTMYRLEWPLTGYVQTDFHKSEREAIDAAIAGEK